MADFKTGDIASDAYGYLYEVRKVLADMAWVRPVNMCSRKVKPMPVADLYRADAGGNFAPPQYPRDARECGV
jgi:hypothetical protein